VNYTDQPGPSAARAQEELFVANAAKNSVTIDTHTASGNTEAIRMQSVAALGLNFPGGVRR